MLIRKIFFLILLYILQTTFFSQFLFFGVSPDLLFLGLIIICLLLPNDENFFIALIIGVFLDNLTKYPFLFHTTIFLLTPVAIQYFRTTIFSNLLLLGLFYMIISTFLFYSLYFFLVNSPATKYDFSFFYNQIYFPTLIYNIFLLFFLYFLGKLLFTQKKNIQILQ